MCHFLQCFKTFVNLLSVDTSLCLTTEEHVEYQRFNYRFMLHPRTVNFYITDKVPPNFITPYCGRNEGSSLQRLNARSPIICVQHTHTHTHTMPEVTVTGV